MKPKLQKQDWIVTCENSSSTWDTLHNPSRVLGTEELRTDLSNVFDTTIKSLNLIKQKPLITHLFAFLEGIGIFSELTKSNNSMHGEMQTSYSCVKYWRYL